MLRRSIDQDDKLAPGVLYRLSLYSVGRVIIKTVNRNCHIVFELQVAVQGYGHNDVSGDQLLHNIIHVYRPFRKKATVKVATCETIL